MTTDPVHTKAKSLHFAHIILEFNKFKPKIKTPQLESSHLKPIESAIVFESEDMV